MCFNIEGVCSDISISVITHILAPKLPISPAYLLLTAIKEIKYLFCIIESLFKNTNLRKTINWNRAFQWKLPTIALTKFEYCSTRVCLVVDYKQFQDSFSLYLWLAVRIKTLLSYTTHVAIALKNKQLESFSDLRSLSLFQQFCGGYCSRTTARTVSGL